MTERLDQIERILSNNAQQLEITRAVVENNAQQLEITRAVVDANAQQVANNTESINLLMREGQAAREREDAARAEYRRLHDEQGQRIQNLIDDARADRQSTTQKFEAVQARTDEARAEDSRRFEAVQVSIDEARAEDRRRFDAAQLEANRRFDAQMQISQAMLTELARLNTRVEYLEQRAS